MEIYLLILAGIIVGVCSGLFGIGGGTIIVPLMFFLLKNELIPTTVHDNLLAQQVIFTSLAVVVCTSTVSSYSHWKRGGLDYPYFTRLVGGLLLGSIIGSLTLTSISEQTIKLILTIFFLIIAYSFAVNENVFIPLIKRIVKIPLIIMGYLIGWVAVILGIGGGILNVGILTSRGLSMKKAVGTSASCGLLISLSAVVMSMILAAYSGEKLLNYIHMPFFLSIFIVAGLSSNLGARIAHKLEDKTLKKAFACYLSMVALWFIIDIIRTYW